MIMLVDEIEAEHLAIELYSQHYEQFRNVCLRCCAQILGKQCRQSKSSKHARQQLLDELLGEVFDRLPSICEHYNPDNTGNLTLIAWATYSIQFHLRRFKQFKQHNNLFLLSDIELSSMYSMSDNRNPGNLNAETVCIIRGVLSKQEFDILWLRHAEEYTLEQIAYAMNISKTHAARKLNLIELHLQKMISKKLLQE